MKLYNYIERKTLLYKSGVEYADFCVNHVEGCAHGCRFPCYAFLLKRRCGVVKSYNAWRKPKIVKNALSLLDKEIPRYKNKIDFVHLCFTTDPFMYGYSEIGNLSLQIIEKFHKNSIRCVVLTKGIYPEILINCAKYGKSNQYGISLVSLDKAFKNSFEPHSAPYEERIAALEYLHERGLKTWISMEPYPTPNLIKQNLSQLLERVSFVDKIVFGKMNYNVEASKTVFKASNEFYEQCAKEVIAFCSKRRIDYHIKYGTRTNNDKKTGQIFSTSVPKLCPSK